MKTTIMPLYLLKGERGKREEIRPTLVTDDVLFRCCRKMFLFPEWAIQFLVYDDLGDIYPNQAVVEENVSPVLVYNPCVLENDGSLRIGRFYYAYRGAIPRSYKKSIGEIFSWVRRHSVQVPRMGSFRILESASKNVPQLRQWVGPPEPNPFFEKPGGVHGQK